MNAPESHVQALVMRRLGSKPHIRIFRNQVGNAWVGKSLRTDQGILLPDGRMIRAGLFVGSGDLIGWRSVTIGEEHLGHTIAQFLSVEVKAGKGKLRPEQVTWRDQVVKAGGIAIVTNDPDSDTLIQL